MELNPAAPAALIYLFSSLIFKLLGIFLLGEAFVCGEGPLDTSAP